jgi:hypothetical protein
LRPSPARTTNPDPINISVAGSGTAETLLSLVTEPVSEIADFEGEFDLLSMVAESSEGQPAIPENIITTHKNINNFFIVPLFIINIPLEKLKFFSFDGACRVFWLLRIKCKRKIIERTYRAIYFVCQELNDTIYAKNRLCQKWGASI